MQRIGILGGSFDPIHIGHMEMARAAARELARIGEPPDKMLIIPAGHPYFKGDITPYEMRCEMTGISVDELNEEVLADGSIASGFHYELSYLERDEGTPTYTYETLRRIHEEYPGSVLYFICGEDVYDSIHKWRCPELVLEEAALVVFERKSTDDQDACEDPVPEGDDRSDIASEQRIEQLRKLYDRARIIPVRSEIPAVSSTQIRNAVSNGISIDGLVSEGVSGFIRENSLYRS